MYVEKLMEDILEKKFQQSEPPLPKFEMILTSYGTCLKRESGIFVVPLACLKN